MAITLVLNSYYTQHHFVNAGGDPVQLNYSLDDDNYDNGFEPISEHFDDEYSVMNNQTDVFGDNFAATATKYVYVKTL